MELVNSQTALHGTDVLSKYLNKLKIKSKHHADARAKWAVYFGEATLDNFQQLCEDLDLHGDLSNKRKCKMALRRVYVNIPQFLKAMGTPALQVTKFASRHELTKFTMSAGKKQGMFRSIDLPKGCPLRQLMRKFY